MSVPRLALPLVLAAVIAAGCGGGGEPAPASTPAVTQVDVDISAPANGEAVVARQRVGSRLVAAVTVEGTADVGASLIARTSCEEADCQHSFTTDTDGSFSERVEVWAAADGRNGSIEVGAAGSAPADRDRVVVLVQPPERQRNTEVKEKAKPRKAPKRRKRGKRRAAQPPPVVQPIPVLPPESEAEPPVTLPPAPEIPPPASTTGRTVIMIGDSLAQGTEPYLAGQLAGWSVATDARRGRPLAEGMQVLARTQVPGGPVILAFSLFTNDAPTNVAALESAVRTSVQRAGARGCAVWATIVRPPVGGASYAAANAKLGQLANDPQLRGRLLIVPWAAAVASNPSLVGKDGVHATSAGYQERARLYAATARTCRA